MSKEISLYFHPLPGPGAPRVIVEPRRLKTVSLWELWVPGIRTLKLRTGVKWEKSKGLKNKGVSLRQVLEAEAKASGGRAREGRVESCRWCGQRGETLWEYTLDRLTFFAQSCLRHSCLRPPCLRPHVFITKTARRI